MRTTIKAKYRGKVVVWPIDEITHFIHADKYVTAYNEDGRQLLLTDTIKTLAADFADQFIEIRRGTLVRGDLLVGVEKQCGQSNGVAYIAGIGSMPCARKRLPALRRYLRERTSK